MSSNGISVVSTSRGRFGDRGHIWYRNFSMGACAKYVQAASRRQAVRLIALVVMLAVSLLLVHQWASMNAKDGSVIVGLTDSGTTAKPSSSVPPEASQSLPHDSVKQLSELDRALIPGKSYETTSGQGRRLIFIGDIHGCYDELMQLLSEAEYNAATDHIIAAGDMVNKGPNSKAVVDFLISRGASCVRGNHDDRILKKRMMEVTAHIPGVSPDPEMVLARSLTPVQAAYLNSCPIVLRVGEVPSHGNIVVVHAGLVPSLELIDQDPISAMNMRIIDPMTHIPSKEHQREGHVPWADFWNQEQIQVHDVASETLRNRHLDTTVIYGHDAKRGLQIQKYTKGLDSGCVKGRQLTALILSNNAEEKVVQVQCHQYL